MANLTGIFQNQAAQAMRHYFNGAVEAAPVQYAQPEAAPDLGLSRDAEPGQDIDTPIIS